MNGPPFPYKVVKALDPVIYRNVEYDIWVEAKKGCFVVFHVYFQRLLSGIFERAKFSEQIRARQDILKRLKFTPGDKCLVPKLPIPFGGVKAGGDPSKDGWYRGIVQDVIGEQGPVSVSVFVEELGERQAEFSITDCCFIHKLCCCCRLIIPYAHLRSVPSESESELKPFHFSPPQSTDETSLDSSSIDSPEKSSSRKGSFLDHQETVSQQN